MFNMPYLKGVGKWLGSGIGQIFGSGDYTLVGPAPQYNIMMNGNQTPKFSTGDQTNIVCHREYLGDITGAAAFTNRTYRINPGDPETFPWLAALASHYQEYRFHGIIFEFRSLITDFVTSGAPGVAVMATNYNSDAPAYISRQQMENSEYAVSVKPTKDLMHGIECAASQTVLPKLFVRTGDVPTGQDLRLYDLGLFQLATQNNPAQNLGELWVSYCVEFFKPVIPITPGFDLGYKLDRSGVTPAAPFGNTTVVGKGDLTDFLVDSTSIRWTGLPGTRYLVTYFVTGTSVAMVAPVGSNINCTTLPNIGAPVSIFVPANGETSTRFALQTCLLYTGSVPDQMGYVLGVGGTIPSGIANITVQTVSYASAN
jgi:hypothetical protein